MAIKLLGVVLSALVLIDKVNSDKNNKVVDVEWEAVHPPFDPEIYEDILDAELCTKQIEYLALNDTLLMLTCKYCYRFLFTFCMAIAKLIVGKNVLTLFFFGNYFFIGISFCVTKILQYHFPSAFAYLVKLISA